MVMMKKKVKAAASGFKYVPRSAEDVKERANRQIGGRDSYFNQEIQFFTPPEKDSTVRIMPPPPDADWRHYGFSIAVHYDIGADGSAYLCLQKMKGEPCPICEARDEATAKGEEELADALKPGFRTAVYVIDRSSESKGPMVWNVSAGLDKDITKLTIDPGTGEALPVDDPVEGYDFAFVRTGKGLKTKYSGLQFARKATPLADDDEDAEKWLNYIVEHPLDEQLLYHEYDYIAKVLSGQAPAKVASDDDSEEETPRGKKKAAAEPAPVAAKKKKAKVEDEEEEAPPKKSGRPTFKKAAKPAEEEEEEETEEEEEETEEAELPTWDEFSELDDDEVQELADAHGVEFPDDKEFEDADEVKAWVAEQLGIEQPKPAKKTKGKEPVPAAKPSWRDKLAKKK